MLQVEMNLLSLRFSEQAEEVANLAGKIVNSLTDAAPLQELQAAANNVAGSESPTAKLLVESILEIGILDCIVVAPNGRCASMTQNRLSRLEVPVYTQTEYQQLTNVAEQAYVIGPPSFYSPSIYNAPSAENIAFIMPNWYQNRKLPRSPLWPYLESQIEIETRTYQVGSSNEEEPTENEEETESKLEPRPSWDNFYRSTKKDDSDQVEARRILLSGELGIWLDDAERIRTLDPRLPVGQRITLTDVSNIQTGDYLLLRQGETEPEFLRRLAFSRLEDEAADIMSSQDSWKGALKRRMQLYGETGVDQELQRAGIRRHHRAKSWSERSFIRPNDDDDFRNLLDWLNIPREPTISNADKLRAATHAENKSITKRLEEAVQLLDHEHLYRTGITTLTLEPFGIRNNTVARVLAVSPCKRRIPRTETRKLEKDSNARWLE